MASAMLKLIVLSICLNTFLYLGVNYAIYSDGSSPTAPSYQDTLFEILLRNKTAFETELDVYTDSLESDVNYTRGYNFDMKGNFSSPPTEETGSSILIEQGGFAFLDAARMVLAFIMTLWQIAIIPLKLFTYQALPPLVAVIIGIPLLILNVTALIIFIRGGGAP